MVADFLCRKTFGAIRKAGTVVVVGVSNERGGAPVPGFNAITVAMFQQRIQGSLCGMGSPRDAMPNLLNLYAQAASSWTS